VNDFDGLCNWCDQAANEVQKDTQANPIRGKELDTDKLNALKREPVGKTIHWRMKVIEIDPAGHVRLGSFHRMRRPPVPPAGYTLSGGPAILGMPR
jgi:hypothetical protein